MVRRINVSGIAVMAGLLGGCTAMQQGDRVPDIPVVQKPADLATNLDEIVQLLGKAGKQIEKVDNLLLKCGCVGDVTTAKVSMVNCGLPPLLPCQPGQLPAVDVLQGLNALQMIYEAQLQGLEVKIEPSR
jgi:hypothetical protein